MSYGRQLGKTVAAIFVVAVLGNYPWELAQAPLYVGMESFRAVWWHCFVASLGDGLLVLGIFAIGWLLLRRHTWFVHPGIQGYGAMVTTGLVIGITIEWRLLLDSRVVDLPIAYNPTCVIFSSLKPLFFNNLKNES